MALGDPYCTITELKSYLGITDAADDTQLTNAVTATSRAIERHCRRQFNDAGTATARLFVPGTGTRTEVHDFSTITGLVIKTDEGDAGTFATTWATTDYQLEPLDGIVDGQTGWPYWVVRAVAGRRFPFSARATLQVTARWGWASVPADVKQAALILSADTFRLKGAPFGIANVNDFSVTIRPNGRVAELLKPFRLHPVLVG